MRLFRQKERGNWNEVIEQVAEALETHFRNSSKLSKLTVSPKPVIKPQLIQDILIPTSLGELIDKITILQIKTQKLEGVALENVNSELTALEKILNNLQIKIESTLVQHLKDINQGFGE